MNRNRIILGFLLLIVSLVGSLVMAAIPCETSSVIELFNNTEDPIFVGKERIEPNKSLQIPFDKSCTNTPLFTIKDKGTKGCLRRYRVYYKQPDSENPYIESPLIKLDFITLRFIATAVKKNKGYDEICLHNDTPYDTFVSYLNKKKDNIDEHHKRRGITIEPGRTFHKTVYCAKSKTAPKNLRTLGLLLVSIMTAESKDIYSVPYHRRIYARSSLIGNEGWKTVTLSADTIKWFNNGFSVACSQG